MLKHWVIYDHYAKFQFSAIFLLSTSEHLQRFILHPPQPPLPCKTVFPRVYWNHPSGWLFSWLVCLSPKMIWVLVVWSDLPQILRNHFKILYYKLWTDQKCARHIFSFQSCHGLQNYSPLNFAMFLLFNFTMNFGA